MGHEDEILGLNYLADQARKLGDREKSGKLFAIAVLLIGTHGARPEVEAMVCSNFGILQSSLGHAEEAIRLQSRALELDVKRGASVTDLGFSYHNLGVALIGAGKTQDGVEQLKQALTLRRAVPDQELVYTLSQLAEACLELDQLVEAEKHAQESLNIAISQNLSDASRYGLAVLAAVAERRGDNDRAAEHHSRIIDRLEELRRNHKTLERLDLFDSRYNMMYLKAIEFFLRAERFGPALALIDRTRFRSGCDTIEGVRAFGSLSDSQALNQPNFRKNELVLVEWIYPDCDWSFPMIACNPHLRPRKIKTSDSSGPPRRLELSREWKTHFGVTLGQTQKVIDDYKSELKEVARIVVVPHGSQWQTPYAALLHPDSSKRLSETHEVLLLPSLRYGTITESRPRLESRNNLVIGDPTGDLPGARKEASMVAARLGCKAILGRDATRSRVMGVLNQAEFDIIHYAGHGSYSGAGVTNLVLADGAVNTDDILKSKVKANLVNLASCWCGMTEFSVWNELDGLVRALLCTGTRNVISSVYPVNDAIAMSFSNNFL